MIRELQVVEILTRERERTRIERELEDLPDRLQAAFVIITGVLFGTSFYKWSERYDIKSERSRAGRFAEGASKSSVQRRVWCLQLGICLVSGWDQDRTGDARSCQPEKRSGKLYMYRQSHPHES